MKCSYKLCMVAVFALLVSVAVSEESIEVTVDNTPKPNPKEIALMQEVEGLNAELKRVNENMKSKQAKFEKELTEKMKEIELLKDQLQKKQKAFAELEMLVSNQNNKLQTLTTTNSKLQDHIDKLNAPITFLDFVVDAFEHHILPGCEMMIEKVTPYVNMAIEKVTPYVNMAIEYCKMGWAAVVEFWNTNEVCLKTRAVVVEYYTKLAHIVSTFWKETVMPKLNELLEPYYPTLTEYYQKACEAMKTAWRQACTFVCEKSHMAFYWSVDKYEVLYTELNKVCEEYAPFLHYMVLVAVLTVVKKLLCLCCPCKCCCCKKCTKKCCC